MSSIKVPPLGESIVEATVSRWLKKEGDAVAVGDSLVELETDKITVEVPALEAGTLTSRAKGEGDVVAVGDVLGEIAAGAAGAGAATAAAAPAAAVAAAPAAGSAGAGQAAGTDPKVSPAAARLATETGIDPAAVPGSGRGGVVSKADVMGAVAAGSAAAPAPAPAAAPVSPPTAPAPAAASGRETREKMTTRRKRIAENLLQSQHATAHLTTFNEIDMTAITALRERLKERVEKEQGVKLSFMPFFAKAAALALKAYPVVNAQIDGDTIVYKHYVNMGIAVASDAGLVVPNVKDCDQKSVVQIGKDIGAVAKRARDGKLSMDDLTGGTFTITNGGVFGSLISTPIINYPQVGILGLHKTQDRPVAIDGQVEIRPMMYVALSYDHRIIDGQQAVLFLVRVKELMEDPAAMLVY
ncbi:MAG: 2-oxoglutarate dehydrogenase complex dihydrolipoyllysine-residue succinyltransferase [Gemmatimonas sp.]|jgi:2-oxoglutarate dehydrogenase E2 component (dihydrolipoamide succinyltransferase)|uniref:2-oxoglutarate dehydrogenase complex dihydrolipoyllysine-residue succinyltransferase n=3 Tax=Gemmatimonas sp. TaxID=1962908 RepID=UPI0022BF1B19|nr:2-oxoglutarate dehydrogenase complex dihydrolipoyllysine-residue succinyltransferase [Gemmatimonas sp.]MCE2953071.1 2-oxoglutarate dehydrogenase complex dihydrolipoyllysine-residue succinyltransferase [Gemmatimonas sp.]MCZ8011676.1 2-oxoglutarate dehydrogenase complex dihydrolipoyllysine-residue succinyltransferase [Gemmatimonas sp.]MCZ8265775.1 2-oxoglutarate dehydrogenase complex dihydrolipoyllysine-residue succinyltransferase [Gemmatimonas sp.]